MKNKLSKQIRRFLFSKRAVNVVVSAVLMASAVMALGFVVLYWTQQRALEANVKYSETTDENIAKTKEKLVFEHICYNYSDNTLAIYLMNCGASNDVGVARIDLSGSSWSQSFSDIDLKFLNGTGTQSLDIGEEGYFEISVSLVSFYVCYLACISTERGRLFATSFVA